MVPTDMSTEQVSGATSAEPASVAANNPPQLPFIVRHKVKVVAVIASLGAVGLMASGALAFAMLSGDDKKETCSGANCQAATNTPEPTKDEPNPTKDVQPTDKPTDEYDGPYETLPDYMNLPYDATLKPGKIYLNEVDGELFIFTTSNLAASTDTTVRAPNYVSDNYASTVTYNEYNENLYGKVTPKLTSGYVFAEYKGVSGFNSGIKEHNTHGLVLSDNGEYAFLSEKIKKNSDPENTYTEHIVRIDRKGNTKTFLQRKFSAGDGSDDIILKMYEASEDKLIYGISQCYQCDAGDQGQKVLDLSTGKGSKLPIAYNTHVYDLDGDTLYYGLTTKNVVTCTERFGPEGPCLEDEWIEYDPTGEWEKMDI